MGIVYMFYSSLQDNQIEIHNQVIDITGDYGMELKTDNIKLIELVSALPDITLKINGFALKTVLKGEFQEKGGKKIKLLINSNQTPIILIITNNNQRIYYSSKDKSNQEIFNHLQKAVER